VSDIIAERARELAKAFDRSFQLPVVHASDDGRAALAIQAGGDGYLIPLAGLSNVARAPRIVRLPASSAAVGQLGIAGIGGRLTGVFSLPALLGYDVTAPPPAWIAVIGEARPVALAFDLLEGHVVVPAMRIAGTVTPGGARRHVTGVVLLSGETSQRGVIDLDSIRSRLAE
jgi:chemotaxis signal transduction protein